MNILGVMGGMGPMATVDFLRKVVANTAAKEDRDHIHTLTDSRCSIPDRTEYIAEEGESPAEKLIETALRLQRMGAEVIVMPCNTAHYFYEDIRQNLKVEFINMVEETAKTIVGKECVGLLATKGTYHARIYEKTFKKYDIQVVQPPEDIKEQINTLIYDIKGGEYGPEEHREDIDTILEWFKNQGIDTVILGCSELPLIFENTFKEDITLIDPSEILAMAAIRAMGRKRKKEGF